MITSELLGIPRHSVIWENQFDFCLTYRPGAGSITGKVALPNSVGAGTVPLEWRFIQPSQSGHQLPGFSSALSSQLSASQFRLSLTQ